MSSDDQNVQDDLELSAMAKVHAALKGLDQAAQNRVLDYVSRRLSLKRNASMDDGERNHRQLDVDRDDAEGKKSPPVVEEPEGLEGVSPIAQKWMRRNSLKPAHLSRLFSLGLDEIDLVAKSVPGGSKRQKMRNVLLLAGVASYLSSGSAKVTHEKLRETAEHYNAYDGPNFAKHLRAFAAEASGSKETGYTLTALGLTEATTLITEMTSK